MKRDLLVWTIQTLRNAAAVIHDDNCGFYAADDWEACEDCSTEMWRLRELQALLDEMDAESVEGGE